MKRFLALLTALCLLAACAAAEGTDATQEVAAERDGLTVLRMKTSGETDTLQYKVDYPAFQSEDTALADYLQQTVAEPLLTLRKLDRMSADDIANEPVIIDTGTADGMTVHRGTLVRPGGNIVGPWRLSYLDAAEAVRALARLAGGAA